MDEKKINSEVDRVLNFMSTINPDSNEYTSTVQNLRTLCEARSKKPSFLIDPEILITIGANLLSILIIVRHEEFNVVTSRALSLLRPK